jgi:hypothetical protein
MTATPDQWRALENLVVQALHAQDDPELARLAAYKLDKGQYRVVSLFDTDDDGQPDAYSLSYQVELHDVEDRWVPFVKAHWTQLGLTLDDVLSEQGAAEVQNAMGTNPGGPDDPGHA